MNSFVRPAIRQLKAYTASSNASGKIKLDAMENTAPTPAELLDAWQDQFTQAKVNYYPDSTQRELKKAFAQSFEVDETQLLFGNGSDELIQLILLACCENNDLVMTFEPGFSVYKLAASFCRLPFHGVDLNEDFSIPLQTTIKAIEKHNPKVFFIAFPNNPTGNLFSIADIKEIITTVNGLVIIDEAYYPFAHCSLLHELKAFNNVVILRTFSKVGLAGLRLGTLIASPDLVHEINKVRMPYNINTLTQKLVTVWLEKPDALIEQTEKIVQQRTILSDAFKKIVLFETVYPSQANFLLIKTQESCCADKLQTLLAQEGILVKNLHGSHRLLTNCLRISIGEAWENTELLNKLYAIKING